MTLISEAPKAFDFIVVGGMGFADVASLLH